MKRRAAFRTQPLFIQNELEPARKVWEAQLPTDPAQRWKTIIPITEELKLKARKLGLWNLFLSRNHYPEYGVPLTNLEVCHRCLRQECIEISLVCGHGRVTGTLWTVRI